MTKKTGAGEIKSVRAATSTRVLRGKFRKVSKTLQDATEKQLATLLKQLLDGKRKIPPDIELSELEAGILIENLDAHVRDPHQWHICRVIWRP